MREGTGRRGVLHPAESDQWPLLALELLGSPLQRPRRVERDVGIPRRRERSVLPHARALRREPVLPPRGRPLDRDAAGVDRDDDRRRVRIPSEAPGGISRVPELLGAWTPVPNRMGLSPVPRLARTLSQLDPEGVLPPQLLGR